MVGFAIPQPTLRPSPHKRELRIVVASPLHLNKAFRRCKPRVRRLLDDHQSVWRQPAAVAQRHQRTFRKPLAVGRIEKHQPEWLIGMHCTELRRIAAENARDAAEAERLDVLSDQRARFSPIIDKEGKGRATRHRLQAERSGAGEQVEHTGAGDRVVKAVRQDVEERLAQAVAGRPYVLRLRRRQRAPAEPPADDAHSARPRRPWDGRSRPRRSWTRWTRAGLAAPALAAAFGPGTEFRWLFRSGLIEAHIGKSRPRRPWTGRSIRRRAPAGRTPMGRCFCGLRLFLFRTEPLHQDAATLAVGREAGALVRPRLVRDLEVITPGAAIGSAQGRIILAPGVAAARAPGRLFGALVALAPAQRAAVVAVASSGGMFATAALVRAVA